MSMIGTFAHVTDDEISALLAQPDTVVDFMDVLAEDENNDREIELDKTWHALHWLLTGSEWEGEAPLNFIVAGGTEIGDSDVGYCPARAFTSTQVRRISDALAPISVSDLLAKYDGNAMRDLYPEIWNRVDERNENLEYLAYYFESLKQFVGRCVEAQWGILTFLT